MSLAQNKAIARRHFEELWTRGDLAVAAEIYSPSTVGHCGNLPDQTGYPACEQELVSQDLVAFPDGVAAIEDQIAEGDRVVTRWVARGTHGGTFQNVPATGRDVRLVGTDIDRMAGGKVVECWTHVDELGLMQQLGVVEA